MSARSGVRALMTSKSASSSGTFASRATARRCKTAFVEPPVAITAAMAFSSASRVMTCRGVRPALRFSTARRPAAKAKRSFAPSIAGTELNPSGEGVVSELFEKG